MQEAISLNVLPRGRQRNSFDEVPRRRKYRAAHAASSAVRDLTAKRSITAIVLIGKALLAGMFAGIRQAVRGVGHAASAYRKLFVRVDAAAVNVRNRLTFQCEAIVAPWLRVPIFRRFSVQAR